MTEQMLIFTLGPVQGFIATARKTEDLWLGSYLLSYFCATAIQQVYDQSSIRLIFPAIGNQDPFDFWRRQGITTASFPNRFLALSTEQDPQENLLLLQQAESAVGTEFANMADQAFNFFQQALGQNWRWDSGAARQILERQVANFLQIYWVVSPWAEQENYQTNYAMAEKRLAAVKNCRPFEQTEEGGRKCSLCGERQILTEMDNWQQFLRRRPKYIRPNEGLCAVCLTKRVAGEYKGYLGQQQAEVSNLTFPSTAEVATANFKAEIAENSEKAEIYTRFVDAVNQLQPEEKVSPVPKLQSQMEANIDGRWLFEESLDPSVWKRESGLDLDPAQMLNCQLEQRRLIDKVGFPPSAYYAIVQIDGDNMGSWVGACPNASSHQDISQKLVDYSSQVQQLVEVTQLGKLVYAGGDDVLALVNLNDLLWVLNDLRLKFPSLNDSANPSSSASAGVCIAHHKTPLGDAIDQARKMEQAAKGVEGKNALGISLLKHSGNLAQTVLKWSYPNPELNLIEISDNLIQVLNSNNVSKKFIYSFRTLFDRFDQQNQLDDSLIDLVQAEFQRLLLRASQAGQQEMVELKTADLKHLMQITEFSNFLNYLEIINFIARETKK
jgi:CRISPR-associated protein Cmr2